jgi:hypothetical protein
MQRPSIPDPPHSGGCLCGAVRYRLDARPLAINACHCRDCQKLSGATNLLTLVGARNAFAKESGETRSWRKRAESGREIDIVRCATCGVRVWQEPVSAPDLIFIAAGTLDDPSWAIAAAHIWVGKAQPGAIMRDDAVKIAGQPADRVVTFEAFERLYPDT